MRALEKRPDLCRFFYGIAFLACFSLQAVASDYAVRVVNTEVQVLNEQYRLNTGFDFNLSPKARQALQNGIPLYWQLNIRLMQLRRFWWAKTLRHIRFNYRIQYLALLNLYRVQNLTTGEVENLSTLASALDVIAQLQKFPLIEQSRLPAGQQYRVEIKLDFVREKLPLPLRPSSYLDSQWYLSSARFLCSIQP